LLKKERDSEHSNGSEHDNDIERTTSARRLRDSDSHKRVHAISHRLVGTLIEMDTPVEGPHNVNTLKS